MNRNETLGKFYSLYRTQLGTGAAIAGEQGLVEVLLPFGGESVGMVQARLHEMYPGAVQGNALTEDAADLLQRYFAGNKVTFDQLAIDMEQFSPFQRLVYRAVAAIPYGEVRTYGHVAAEIGRLRAARGIGTAMARNPLPVIIPCHRVVGTTGLLTGYSAPGGLASKRQLLLMEGIVLDEKGRVKSIPPWEHLYKL